MERKCSPRHRRSGRWWSAKELLGRTDAVKWSGVALGAFLLAASGSALANGMPAESVPLRGVHGGIVPLETSGVELVAERLRIEVGERVTARAEYTLRNPGPPRTLLYAVPLAYEGFHFQGQGLARERLGEMEDELALGVSEIKITIGGKLVPCEVRPERRVRYSPAADLRDAVEAWCVARITVPNGEGISLLLESPLGVALYRSIGRFTYALWPAGHWSGPVRKVDIELDLGPYADVDRVVSPAGGVREGRWVRWRYRDVDLKALGSVVIETPIGGLEPWRFSRWLRATTRLAATATSALAPQAPFDYAPLRAIDGDPRTAWCEGVKGDGVGESLQVTMSVERPPGDVECRLLRVDLATGFRWDEATYQANGRASAVRVERCADASDGVDVSLGRKTPERQDLLRLGWLRDDDGPADGPIEIHLPRGVLAGEPSCIRLIILGAKPGKRYHDTCISEVVPHVYCRTPDDGARPPRSTSSRAEVEQPANLAALSPEDLACASEVNGLVGEAVSGGRPGAWDRLLAKCAECAKPFKSDALDPLAWRRCEVAQHLSKASAALAECRGTQRVTPDSSYLCSPLGIAIAFGARLREIEDLERRQVGQTNVP